MSTRGKNQAGSSSGCSSRVRVILVSNLVGAGNPRHCSQPLHQRMSQPSTNLTTDLDTTVFTTCIPKKNTKVSHNTALLQRHRLLVRWAFGGNKGRKHSATESRIPDQKSPNEDRNSNGNTVPRPTKHNPSSGQYFPINNEYSTIVTTMKIRP